MPKLTAKSLLRKLGKRVADGEFNPSDAKSLAQVVRALAADVEEPTEDELIAAQLRRWEQRLAYYGLTQSDIEALLAHQNELCAICRETKPQVIDHDHASGAVRGLLCPMCNTLLGQARDSLDRLAAAACYLTKPPAARIELEGYAAVRRQAESTEQEVPE